MMIVRVVLSIVIGFISLFLAIYLWDYLRNSKVKTKEVISNIADKSIVEVIVYIVETTDLLLYFFILIFLFFLLFIVWKAFRFILLSLLFCNNSPRFKADKCGDDKVNLLRHQKKIVDEIIHKAEKSIESRLPGQLIAIEGEWGSGKSHILKGCEEKAEKKGYAFVYVHVWRERDEWSLHQAIVKEIIKHPAVCKRCVYYYPLRLVASVPISILRGWVVKLKLIFSKADLEMNLGLSKDIIHETYQVALERAAACMQKKGKAIIVALDEIDRSTRDVAQAAIVLTRRSLELPGITVILPYVREQLEEKCFNPAIITHPELRHTVLAYFTSKDPSLYHESISDDDKAGIEPDIDTRLLNGVLSKMALLPLSKREKVFEDIGEKFIKYRISTGKVQAGDIKSLLECKDKVPAVFPNNINGELVKKLISSLTDGEGAIFARSEIRSIRSFYGWIMGITHDLMNEEEGVDAINPEEAEIIAFFAFVISMMIKASENIEGK